MELYTYMNTVDLYLIHIVFIVACVYFSYRSGQRSGRSEMVTDLLDRNMLRVENQKRIRNLDNIQLTSENDIRRQYFS